jgi:hypothetical protein
MMYHGVIIIIYYGFLIITKSGLYGFLSKFQGMSGMAMERDVNSGVVNGCTRVVLHGTLPSTRIFTFFAFFAFS